MSWRFQKSFKVFPGLKMNLSGHGLSATVGASPLSVNFGPHGTYANVTVPGTGLSNRVRLDSPPLPSATPGNLAPLRPMPVAPQLTSYFATEEIRSASTELLNSTNLEPVRKLLREAYEERTAISNDLSAAESEFSAAHLRYVSWDNGFLFKRLFKKAFAARKEQSETAEAKRDELKEQLRLTTLVTDIDVDRQQAEPYFRMRDEFSALAESAVIWDTLDRRRVNRVVERSAASEAITREPVRFDLNTCDILNWEQKVPHLANKNGGDLYLFPGFVLYRASREAFALIDFREVTLTYKPQRFIEDQFVPSDFQVVDRAWAKSNKDGSPDRRFKDNYQIPVALYGKLLFTSPTGLQEEYQISNAALADRFSRAWNLFRDSLVSSSKA
jgi:Protein of unknown function (DUF4236)